MLLAVGSLLLVVLIGQLGLAVYVSIDAKRRQLEQPGQYAAGVSIPFLGLLVFGVYRSYRDEFSRREPLESGQAAEPDRQRVESKRDSSAGPAERPPPDNWTIRVSGLTGTPRRFAYSVAGLGRFSWGAIVGYRLPCSWRLWRSIARSPSSTSVPVPDCG